MSSNSWVSTWNLPVYPHPINFIYEIKGELPPRGIPSCSLSLNKKKREWWRGSIDCGTWSLSQVESCTSRRGQPAGIPSSLSAFKLTLSAFKVKGSHKPRHLGQVTIVMLVEHVRRAISRKLVWGIFHSHVIVLLWNCDEKFIIYRSFQRSHANNKNRDGGIIFHKCWKYSTNLTVLTNL